MSYTLTSVAQCGGEFSSFAPYVASINERGVVAFQASLAGGRTGVFACEEGRLRTVVETGTGAIADVYSHPDINERDEVAFYAAQDDGGTGVFVAAAGSLQCVATFGPGGTSVGPLGPTMSEDGRIAFRAEDAAGERGVYSWSKGLVTTIACADAYFTSFDGLPVVVDGGALVFRSTSNAGLSEIYLSEGEELTCVADSAGQFSQLGRFPFLSEVGQVAFVAERPDGSGGAFAVHDGVIRSIAETSDGFAEFRGVLLPTPEQSIFYATPVGGELGIYAGQGPSHARVLGVGDAYGDSTVSAFALNPVSVNAKGQLAIRIELSSGQQAIVLADPQ